MKTVMIACSLLLLGGCASNGQLPWAGFSAQGSCAKPNSNQELSLNLADDMANEGNLAIRRDGFDICALHPKEPLKACESAQ